MAQKAGIPPTSRRIFMRGLGSQAGKQLGSFVYKSPALRRTKTPTQGQIYAQQTLAVAARFVSLAQAWEYQTAKDLAGSSGYTWKDQLIAGFFGTALEFTDTDGVLWQGRRILAAEIQTLLDSITAVEGSILVRTPTGWAALYIGSPNYILTVDPATNLPNWIKSDAVPALDSGKFIGLPQFKPNTSTGFNANFIGARLMKLQAGQIIKNLGLWVHVANAASKILPVIYSDVAGVMTTLLAQGAQVTGAVQGENLFAIDYTVTADQWVWAGLQVQASTIQLGTSITNFDEASFSSSGAPPTTATGVSYGVAAASGCWWLQQG